MTLRNSFLQSPAFTFHNNIFYQKDLSRSNAFEKAYLSLREKENRIYPDELVSVLPEIYAHHPLKKEWMMRKSTIQPLILYLNKKNRPKILELGCGNGWLANHLATIPNSEVIGMDINETELIQGVRVFKETENLLFVYADILKISLPHAFDYIILSSSVQYFSDMETLFDKLLNLLASDGEIHVIDSPVYRKSDVAAANKRSEEYFARLGFPQMKQHYYHHVWQMFESFHPEVLYNPDTLLNKMKRKFFIGSPFPWIKIAAREDQPQPR